MIRLLGILALMLPLFFAVPVFAQQPPAPAPGPETKAERPAERLYREAFELLADGDQEGCRQKLKQIVDEHPSDPLAPHASWLYQSMDTRTSPKASERSTGLAKAEFITFQTAHGVAIGAELCVALDCDTQGYAASLISGGSLGLGLSLWASWDGIPNARVQSLNTGVIWGAWHAAALYGMNAFGSDKASAVSAIGLQLAGLGIGELIYQWREPSPGDVSLATATGVWTGALTTLFLGASDLAFDDNAVFAAALVGSDVGLIAGSFISGVYPMSRSRVLLINAGGAIGLLTGFGIPFLLAGDDVNTQVAFTSMMFGTVGGLGLTTYLTRNWDKPIASTGPDFHFGFTPTDGGLTVNAGVFGF